MMVWADERAVDDGGGSNGSGGWGRGWHTSLIYIERVISINHPLKLNLVIL